MVRRSFVTFLLSVLVFPGLVFAGNGSSRKKPKPQVVSEFEGGLVPRRLSQNVPINTQVAILFTLDAGEEFTSSNFRLYRQVSSTNASGVASTTNELVASTVNHYGMYTVLSPSQNLEPNQTYEVQFDSFTRNNLDTTWTFTTGTQADVGEAIITNTNPANGADSFNPTDSIRITLDRDMSPDTFFDGDFYVEQFANKDPAPVWEEVPGFVEYDFQDRQIVFTPVTVRDFAYDAEVRVVFDPQGAEDFYGNPFETVYEFSFTTRSSGSASFYFSGRRTWVVPKGVYEVTITAEGADGGDGSDCSSSSYSYSTGGGSGDTRTRTRSVVPGGTFTLDIGDGGSGGSSAYLDSGSAGEDTDVTYIGDPENFSFDADGGYGGSRGSECDPDAIIQSISAGSDGDDGSVRISWQ